MSIINYYLLLPTELKHIIIKYISHPNANLIKQVINPNKLNEIYYNETDTHQIDFNWCLCQRYIYKDYVMLSNSEIFINTLWNLRINYNIEKLYKWYPYMQICKMNKNIYL